MPREPEPKLCVAFQQARLSTHRHHLTRTHLIMPSALPQLPSSKNRQPLDRERDLEKQGEGKRNSQRNGAGSPRRASGRSAKESARCARRAERAIKNARQRLHLAKPKAERARESLLWRCLRRLPRYGLDRRACGRAHGERSERLKCRSAIVWILPSPARARRACPLPGQRLSIFSVFRKAMHANAQLFCRSGPQDRENRQPLDRERDRKRLADHCVDYCPSRV
jgi:hypothetical protein